MRRAALATDILWVIDDSGSMDPYQKALLAGVPEFARRLGAKAASWSMGVVTTDAKAGAKMQIELSRVTAADRLPGDPDKATLLAEIVQWVGRSRLDDDVTIVFVDCN